MEYCQTGGRKYHAWYFCNIRGSISWGCLTFVTTFETEDGNKFPLAALAVAISVLHVRFVSTIRACTGATTMPALNGYDHSEVFMLRRGGDISAVTHYTPEGKDLTRPFPAKISAAELQEVN